METEELINVDEICTIYSIEYSLVQSFHESGLIEITSVQEARYLYRSQLAEFEKMVRLHHELGINLEGIEAIGHMLQRMETLQNELRHLRNRLRIYESSL